MEIVESESANNEFGSIDSFEKNKGFTVLCGKGKIIITEVQPENKPVMSAWSFLQGGQLSVGDKF